MTICDYLDDAKEILDELNIPYGNISSIKVSGHMTSAWGYCRKFRRTDCYEIVIAKRLFDSNNYKAVMTTVLHELLHSVPGCMNHGHTWQYYANKVNYVYDYDIKRLTSSAEKGVETKRTPYKYAVTCPKCHNVWKFRRMCDTVKYPSSFRCGKCQVGLTSATL